MKNKITKEKRVIDLNVLTTSLDGVHKQVLLEALNAVLINFLCGNLQKKLQIV